MKKNNYLINKIAKIHFDDELTESIALERVSRLSSLNICDDESLSKYSMLKKASHGLGVRLSDEDYLLLLNKKVSSLNDAYYYIVEKKLNSIDKFAYPNYSTDDTIGVQYDLNKWLKITHMIYDAIRSGRSDKSAAVEFYSNYLDKESEEDVNFKRWFKFYSDGEHLKYASRGNEKMNKKSILMGGLSPMGDSYSHSVFDLPGSSFTSRSEEVSSRESSDASDQKSKSSEFSSWKKRLNSAIRSIDKLLRNEDYLDDDTYEEVSKILNSLSGNIRKVKLNKTASDLTDRAAKSMVKCGYFDGAEILKKVAQEIAEEVEGEPAVSAPEAPVAAPAATPMAEPAPEPAAPPAPQTPQEALKSSIPKTDDVEPIGLENITPIPGARVGEYEDLMGSPTLKKAAEKLDEVAGMLADRRVIRLLAEFDIILDRLGIASMFPELAESQSKLIDASSYALTRVTKMMGQLANAQTLVKSEVKVPGSDEAISKQPPEPTVESQTEEEASEV